MTFLILSPDAGVYVGWAIVLASASSGSLTALALGLSGRSRVTAFLPSYAATLGLLSTVALVVLGGWVLGDPSPVQLVLAVPVGVAGGIAAIRADGAIRSAVRRRHPPRTRIGSARMPIADASTTRAQAMLRPDFVASGGRADRARVASLLGLVGALEEVLYRGVLLSLALELPSPGLIALGVGLGVSAFALSHVELGAEEVLAKVPLSLLTTASVLALHTVAPAIVIHVLFNLHGWARYDGRLPAGPTD